MMERNLVEFIKSLNKYISKMIKKAQFNRTKSGVIIGIN